MNEIYGVLAYSIPESCRLLGIGKTNLYRWISEGKIEARQCGGRTLVPAESLRAFIANLPPVQIRPKKSI